MKQYNGQGSTKHCTALSSQMPRANILYSHLLNSASHQISCILLSWSQFWSPPISSVSFGSQSFRSVDFLSSKRVSYDNLKLSKQTNAVIVKQIPPLFLMSCPHSIAISRFIQAVSLPLLISLTKMKNKLQPTRAPFSRKKLLVG